MKQIIFLVFMFLQVVGHSQVEEVVFRDNAGHIDQTGYFLNDLKTGKWIAYHDNGMIFSEGYYDEGKKEGIWTTYSPTGVKLSQVKYLKGKKHEGWMYDMEGNLVEKRIFQDYLNNE